MITKEQWLEAENTLKHFVGYVKLDVDGYEVTLRLKRVTTYKNRIVVYIDGYIKGEWFLNESEEGRRFFRKRTKSFLTAEQKAYLKKKSKKFQREFYETHNTNYLYYEPYWDSFNALKKHLLKENESIEVIEIN